MVGVLACRRIRQLGGEPSLVIEIIEEICRGNLSDVIHTRKSDISSLLSSIKTMQVGLRDVVEEMQTVESAAVRGAIGQLSKATQQNASASEQLAATSEELSTQVRQPVQSAPSLDQAHRREPAACRKP